MLEVTLISPAIHCDGCAAAIERSLGKLAGVQRVHVSVQDRSVTVTFDEKVTSANAIGERLDRAGFPVKAES
ncbi:MAG: heavy-metal-associated domain-containing protein [Armatimonadetes bacterium]|nr:heavy-metal-associated domain-containing protein [Armatimonadota bacterium]